MHVLGIDAGGTKTVCLLADERGADRSPKRAARAPTCTRPGELAVEKVLHDVMDAAIGDRDIAPARDLPRHRRRRSAGRRAGGRARSCAASAHRVARARRQRRAHRARRRRRTTRPASSSSPAPDRSSTAATPRTRPRAPAAGATCSATRAAATGSAARRSPPSMRAGDGRGPATRAHRRRRSRTSASTTSSRLVPRSCTTAMLPRAERGGARADRAAGARSRATRSRLRILERAADELVARRPSRWRRGSRCAATRSRSSSPAASSASCPGCVTELDAAPRRGRAARATSACSTANPRAGAVWLALAEARGGASRAQIRDTTDRCGFASSPRPGGAARALAADIARALAANPRLVLGLPTGRTPIPLYRELVARCTGARRVDFSPRDDVQPRRVPRRAGVAIRAATARSCSGTCSVT